MTRRIIATVVLWMGVSVGSDAHGAITAFWQQVTITSEAIGNDPALANVQSWDLMVTTTGNWASAGLRAELSSATFYNHPLGGNTKPPPALIQAIPAVAFDTYVTSPINSFGGTAPSILEGFPENQPLSMSGDLISVSLGVTSKPTRRVCTPSPV